MHRLVVRLLALGAPIVAVGFAAPAALVAADAVSDRSESRRVREAVVTFYRAAYTRDVDRYCELLSPDDLAYLEPHGGCWAMFGQWYPPDKPVTTAPPLADVRFRGDTAVVSAPGLPSMRLVRIEDRWRVRAFV